MSDVPEIAPEIRGLLEEIVADPRSSIRLAPRRALRSWFERGEPIRTREVAATRAERHLIEAHREALASILRDASRIAYCKAPILAHLPVGLDGGPYDSTRAESRWRDGARSFNARAKEQSCTVELLRACLEQLEPRMAHPLATAALGLVPCDLNRLLFAFTVPWGQPRTSIALVQRLASHAQTASLRSQACINLGHRWCSIGQLGAARDRYREACAFEDTIQGRIYAFHLSCCLHDQASALAEASELDDVATNAPDVVEAVRILREWCATRPILELRATKSFVDMLASRFSVTALALFEAYPS